MHALIRTLHASLVFERRARVLCGHLADLLPQGAQVLDVGCGDGSISASVAAVRPDLEISGLEVLPRPETWIPARLFDGSCLPAQDKSVDAVMLIDVLHHTQDPLVLLREAARVARKQVLLKDHTRDGPMAGPRLSFMDWVGNAPHGVALEYNYWSEAQWQAGFAALGLTVVDWRRDIGLYSFPASLVFGHGLHCIVALKP